MTVKVVFIAILSSALRFSNHILTRVQSLSCMLVKGVIPFSCVLNYVRKFADELYVFHCNHKHYLVVHIASMNTMLFGKHAHFVNSNSCPSLDKTLISFAISFTNNFHCGCELNFVTA